MPADWLRRGSVPLGSFSVFRLRSDRMVHPRTGREGEFFVLDAPDWVNVVATTREGKVVLIEQYRHGTQRVTLEIPGGTVEEGEEPLAAGLRELAEETGFGGGSARLLGWCEPNPAIQSNRCWFVAAEGVAKVAECRLDEMEDIAVRLETLARVPALIAAGDVRHALVIAAFARYFEG